MRERNCQELGISGGAAVRMPRLTSLGSDSSTTPKLSAGTTTTTATVAVSCWRGAWYCADSIEQQPASLQGSLPLSDSVGG